MKRILVLGATGMLGSMVYKVLSQDSAFAVIGTQSEDKNVPFYFIVEEGGAGLATFGACDYFINCIGVLSPITDAERAMEVNARFPNILAQYAQKIGARVIHMSTNGVFSGRPSPPPQSSPMKGEKEKRESPQGVGEEKKNTPPLMGGVRGGWQGEGYKENAPHDCTDVYGKSKSDGEVVADHVLNIRTSIVGPSPIKKRGLFEWFRSQPDGATVQGYTNHYWNGVTTLQFAELCRRIMLGNHFEALRREGPAIHFVPNQTVTKYELLVLFQKLLQKRITIQSIEDPRGAQAQLLVSTSKILPSLFPHDIPMDRAIADLKPYAANSRT